MLAAGIKSPVPLEELESHLREEIEQEMKSGFNEQKAFEIAIQRIGQTGALKTEFSKIGGTADEQLKQFVCTIAGVPNHPLSTNMNTSCQNIEPRWATYFKTLAFVFPAIIFWVGSCMFIVPKLKQICLVSNTQVPKPMLTVLGLSELFKNHLFVASIVIIFALILLEWRSRWWRRQRRLVFGISAFLLNSTALISITTMFVLAVLAAANLLNHAK